jgi:hypothetical protein
VRALAKFLLGLLSLAAVCLAMLFGLYFLLLLVGASISGAGPIDWRTWALVFGAALLSAMLFWDLCASLIDRLKRDQP